MILFVNACVRRESRTKRLADYLLGRLTRVPAPDGTYETVEEVRLCETAFPRADEEFLALRDGLIRRGEFCHPVFNLARAFAAADVIAAAAPYWDLSFPAALKQYFEQVNVVGLTFRYSPEGIPESLCRAKEFYYVTTAGGLASPDSFGFGYAKALARSFYGIGKIFEIKAEGLDLPGADEGGILAGAMREIDRITAGRA